MDTPVNRALTSLFCRIFWSLLGPMLLLFAAAAIVHAGTGWFTSADLLFAGLLLATLVSRWADFRYGKRTNSFDEPVTISDVHRYFLAWTVGGAVIWGVANLIGNHLL